MYKRLIVSYSILSSDNPEIDSPNYTTGAYTDINEAATMMNNGQLTRREFKDKLNKYKNTSKYFIVPVDDQTEIAVFVWELKNIPFQEAKAWAMDQ